jgi:hypothetical protein
VRVDPSSDPGRDEYGLPPADIEVPDDARDLDRDVQAYHRELRARRRRMRVSRLSLPLTRHGMVVPLVVACLALTLLTGTLLTVLAGRQVPLVGQRPLAVSPQATSGTTQSRPGATSPATAGQRLPAAQVVVAGQHVELRSLAPAVLAWVPATSASVALLRRLDKQAASAGVTIYFVGTGRAVGSLATVAAQAGPGYSNKVVDDSADALSTFGPVGVTAILAHADGTVDHLDVVRLPSGQPQFVARLRLLAAAARQSSPAPAGAGEPPGPASTLRSPAAQAT